jgi:hypothetical protein
MFYEELAKRDPASPEAIRSFLKLVEPLGVYPDLKASLNLKVDLPEAPRATNLGYISKAGKLWTGPLAWTAPQAVALRYNQTLAELIEGKVAAHEGIYLTSNGASAPKIGELLPQHAQAWADAMKQVIDDLRDGQSEGAG